MTDEATGEAAEVVSEEDNLEGAQELESESVPESTGEAESQISDEPDFASQLADLKKTLGDQGNQIGDYRRENQRLQDELARHSPKGNEEAPDPWAENPHLKGLEPGHRDLLSAAYEANFQQQFGMTPSQLQQTIGQLQSQMQQTTTWNNEEALNREVREMETRYGESWQKYLPSVQEYYGKHPNSTASMEEVYRIQSYEDMTKGQATHAKTAKAQRAEAAEKLAKPSQKSGVSTNDETRNKLLEQSKGRSLLAGIKASIAERGTG